MTIALATTQLHAPAANTAAVVTLAAPGAGRQHRVWNIYWSYDVNPTAGGLTITDGGDTVFSIAITKSGPGYVRYPQAGEGGPNAAVVVTLAAGGAGVTGKVNVLSDTN
jgi:hypothetical protein